MGTHDSRPQTLSRDEGLGRAAGRDGRGGAAWRRWRTQPRIARAATRHSLDESARFFGRLMRRPSYPWLHLAQVALILDRLEQRPAWSRRPAPDRRRQRSARVPFDDLRRRARRPLPACGAPDVTIARPPGPRSQHAAGAWQAPDAHEGLALFYTGPGRHMGPTEAPATPPVGGPRSATAQEKGFRAPDPHEGLECAAHRVACN